MINIYLLYAGIVIGAGLTIWAFIALASSGKDLVDENSDEHLE